MMMVVISMRVPVSPDHEDIAALGRKLDLGAHG